MGVVLVGRSSRVDKDGVGARNDAQSKKQEHWNPQGEEQAKSRGHAPKKGEGQVGWWVQRAGGGKRGRAKHRSRAPTARTNMVPRRALSSFVFRASFSTRNASSYSGRGYSHPRFLLPLLDFFVQRLPLLVCSLRPSSPLPWACRTPSQRSLLFFPRLPPVCLALFTFVPSSSPIPCA